MGKVYSNLRSLKLSPWALFLENHQIQAGGLLSMDWCGCYRDFQWFFSEYFCCCLTCRFRPNESMTLFFFFLAVEHCLNIDLFRFFIFDERNFFFLNFVHYFFFIFLLKFVWISLKERKRKKRGKISIIDDGSMELGCFSVALSGSIDS